MAIITLFIVMNVAQVLLQLQATTNFTFDSRIVGGVAVKRREDFPYQVEHTKTTTDAYNIFSGINTHL